MEAIDHGYGIMQFRDALSLNSEFASKWVDRRRQTAMSEAERQADGSFKSWGGDVYSKASADTSPERFIDLESGATEDELQFNAFLSKAADECMHSYVDHYPESRWSIWWKSRGHIAVYHQGAFLGYHHDQRVGKLARGKGLQWERGIFHVVTAVLIVEQNCSGGRIGFKYIDKDFDSEPGTCWLYPTGYLGTHRVSEVQGGRRTVYLEYFGHGTIEGPKPFTHKER
jgi:hypothetical protein